MPAENKSSKSTDRAKRNAQNGKTRGAVRVHAKKASTVPLKPGDDLMSQTRLDRQPWRTERPAGRTFVKDAATAKQLVEQQLGPLVLAVAKRENWDYDTKSKAHAYVKALTCGDGKRIEGLELNISKLIERLFDSACRDQSISWDTLPGQLTERYTAKTAKYRRPRSLAPVG